MLKALSACLVALCLIASGRAQTASPDEGELVSKDDLMRALPTDEEHTIARVVIKAEEEEISCRPTPKKILAVHYRATPASKYSLNDDRIVIATPEGERCRVLKVLDSDAGTVNGELSSENDFDQDFISIDGTRFLYIRNRISGSGGITEHEVYTISSLNQLSVIPFADVSKSKLLKPGEELRNGQTQLDGDTFHYVAGVYVSQDPECCPSKGSYHADYGLEGGFREDAAKHGFAPDFKFVVKKEWRAAE